MFEITFELQNVIKHEEVLIMNDNAESCELNKNCDNNILAG